MMKSRTRRSARVMVGALALMATTSTMLGAQQNHMSGEARDYLKRVIEQMRERSLNRESIDWKQLEAKAMLVVDSARTIADTYPGIREALTELGDPLGRFQTATGASIVSSRFSCKAAPFTAPTVPKNVGYIKVAPYRGQRTGVEPFAFAGNLQGVIKSGDQENISNWIVDVRGLSGDNYSPALVGLGALLGDGVQLYLVDTRGNATAQEYENGTLKAGSVTFAGAVKAYELTHKPPKVAVLVDGKTAATGEMVAVALKGRREARLFGTPTCGVSPGRPFTFKMEDGGQLFLSSTVIADKNKKRFLGPIQPDEAVDDPDQVVEHAVAWLTKGN